MRTEEQFFAILASSPSSPLGAGRVHVGQVANLPTRVEGQAQAAQVADGAAVMLEQGMSPDAAAEGVLATLPAGAYVPFSIFQVEGGSQARLVECDAPPLFMTRGGALVLPPVIEEETALGHLVRRCEFSLQAEDRLAMVSEGYIRARGWSRRWGWRDIAVSIKRWTDTGCDAEQLLGALVRMYRRLAEGANGYIGGAWRDVTVVAMHVRPIRTVTVWTGPPADPAQDALALRKLMAEPGTRVICGDTTAEIAARLLGAELKMEPRPEGGADEIPWMRGTSTSLASISAPGVADRYIRRHPWAEVPPVSRLPGVGLVTEGLVTLNKARQRMAEAKRMDALPRGEDGATRLARALLFADEIHWVVGLAVNPAQAADAAHTIPLRRAVVEQLIQDLRAVGRLVSVEYL